MYPDGEPVDPGVFVCAEPRWTAGDVFVLGPDRSFRIVDVRPPSTEAAMFEDLTAVWTVDVEASRSRVSL